MVPYGPELMIVRGGKVEEVDRLFGYFAVTVMLPECGCIKQCMGKNGIA